MLAAWGEWPSLKTLMSSSAMPALQLLQFLALKASLFLDVETVLLGTVIIIFGSRFHAGWRTHVQRIAIGLSTASLSQLGMEATWEMIARSAKPQSMSEYQHIMDLREHLFNANSAIYVAVLIWWIWSLWLDEPKTDEPKTDEPTTATLAAANPVIEIPPSPDPEPPATISQPGQS